jgi:hypothetical protein
VPDETICIENDGRKDDGREGETKCCFGLEGRGKVKRDASTPADSREGSRAQVGHIAAAAVEERLCS